MPFSNYIRDLVLNHVLTSSTAAFVTTTTVWLSVHTGDPGRTGTNLPLASTPRFLVHFGPAASATSVNDTAATGVGNATGTVSHIALWDGSATATAHCLWTGVMASGVRMNTAGSSWAMASGLLQVSVD